MITLLINSDDFLCKRHLQRLLSKIAPPADRDFNFDRFSAKTAALAQILNVYKTPPMMATSRTVVVEDGEVFNKDDWDKWSEVLARPASDCHLVLIAEKIDKRTAAYKALAKVADVVEFKKPYANQLPQFLQDEAKNLGLKIQPAACALLVESVGGDLMSLVQELEKLKLAILPATDITLDSVRQFAGFGVLENIFDLTQALAEKNLKKASQLFARFHEQGEPVIRTVSLVISHFRKLLLLKESQKNPKSEAPEKILGVHPFFVKDYQKQAQGFTETAITRIYKKLMTLSEGLRSSTVSSETIFEKFLWETCLGVQ